MFNLGIDIAKKGHVTAVVDQDGKLLVDSFKFTNTADGFAKLCARLEQAGLTQKDTLVGMEATGHYWSALFDFLCSQGYKVAVINPVQTSAFRKVETVRKLKTDAVDAVLIAELVRFKAFEPSAMADEAAVGIRDLARLRMSLVREQTALKNQCKALMDRAFPEYEALFSDMFGAGSLAVLKAFPTPTEIAKTEVQTIESRLRQASRGRLGRARAEGLKSAAQSSVGVSFGAKSLALQVRVLVETIEFIAGQIAELESALDSLLVETPGAWLKTVPGINTALAALIAGEVGDAKRFGSPRQLVAYAGMDASKRQSGESDPDCQMSKRGSPFLRYALMLAADGARKHAPLFRRAYEQARARGKHHIVALSVVARKVAGVCLSLMKEGRAYEPVPPSHHQPGHLKA